MYNRLDNFIDRNNIYILIIIRITTYKNDYLDNKKYQNLKIINFVLNINKIIIKKKCVSELLDFLKL